MKPVRYTPVIGTTAPVLPLDSVRSRFQITPIVPGYRHHCSRASANRRRRKLLSVQAATARAASSAVKRSTTVFTCSLEPAEHGSGGGQLPRRSVTIVGKVGSDAL